LAGEYFLPACKSFKFSNEVEVTFMKFKDKIIDHNQKVFKSEKNKKTWKNGFKMVQKNKKHGKHINKFNSKFI
jgi:hypothetical protein